MSHISESCPIRMSHVTLQVVLEALAGASQSAYMDKSCHIWTSHAPFLGGTWGLILDSESRMSHATYASELCHFCKCVTSNMSESRHIWRWHLRRCWVWIRNHERNHEWVMTYTRVRYAIYVNAWHPIWTSHVTFLGGARGVVESGSGNASNGIWGVGDGRLRCCPLLPFRAWRLP